MKKIETSKLLLIVDYLIMILFILLTIIFSNKIDLVNVDIAWASQLGISSGFYYWKAKSENRVKVPMQVINSLPKDVKDSVNLTDIIISIIQSN